MMQITSVVRVIGLATAALTIGLMGAGCSGSGSRLPGVATTPPQVQSDYLGCSFYLLDFTTEKVELLAADDPRIPAEHRQEQVSSQAVVDAPGYTYKALRMIRTKLLGTPGTPGRYVWHIAIENQSSETYGAQPDGTTTGIEILIPSLTFKGPGGTTVNGGGAYGWTALNPVTGAPIYNTGRKLGPGESLDCYGVELSLPPGATYALAGMLLRADTSYVHVPAVGKCYVTVITGASEEGCLTGPVGSVLLHTPAGIVVKADGDIFLADAANNRVVEISDGRVSPFAGDGTGDDENDLDWPQGLQRYAGSYLVTCEMDDHQISLISSDGSVYRIAGSSSSNGAWGSADGDGDTARFYNPMSVDVLGGTIYVTDHGNDAVRTVTYTGRGARTIAANYVVDTLVSSISYPYGICVDRQGNVFVTDYVYDQVSVIPRGSSTAHIIAGSVGGGHQDGTGDVAKMNQPFGIDDDGAGNLYIADTVNNRIRIMYMTGTDITSASDWTVGTVAGTGSAAIGDGVGAATPLSAPRDLRVGPSGTVFFSGHDYLGRLDRIAPSVPY